MSSSSITQCPLAKQRQLQVDVEALQTFVTKLGAIQTELPEILVNQDEYNDGLTGVPTYSTVQSYATGKTLTFVQSQAKLKRLCISEHQHLFTPFTKDCIVNLDNIDVINIDEYTTTYKLKDPSKIPYVKTTANTTTTSSIDDQDDKLRYGIISQMNGALRKEEIPDRTHCFNVRQHEWCFLTEQLETKEDKIELLSFFLQVLIFNLLPNQTEFTIIKSTRFYVDYQEQLQLQLQQQGQQQQKCQLQQQGLEEKKEQEEEEEKTSSSLSPSLSTTTTTNFVVEPITNLAQHKIAVKAFEDKMALKYKVLFILGIGGINYDYTTVSPYPYDERSCDYDDWEANGDLIVQTSYGSLEISSLGVRVDKHSLPRQLATIGIVDDDSQQQQQQKQPQEEGEEEDEQQEQQQKSKSLKFTQYHKDIMNGTLVQTIGGGIGKDRLRMARLDLEHIKMSNPSH